MIEVLVEIFGLIWFIATMVEVICMATDAASCGMNFFTVVKRKVSILFRGRNVFGVCMSLVVLVYYIPAILFLMTLQSILCLVWFGKYIWSLGDKKVRG